MSKEGAYWIHISPFLQDKIAQVKDARAALDALREEERERKRREAEEAERLRQIQMREKLEVMRKKKQEYLQVLSVWDMQANLKN